MDIIGNLTIRGGNSIDKLSEYKLENYKKSTENLKKILKALLIK